MSEDIDLYESVSPLFAESDGHSGCYQGINSKVSLLELLESSVFDELPLLISGPAKAQRGVLAIILAALIAQPTAGMPLLSPPLLSTGNRVLRNSTIIVAIGPRHSWLLLCCPKRFRTREEYLVTGLTGVF